MSENEISTDICGDQVKHYCLSIKNREILCNKRKEKKKETERLLSQ